MALTHADPEQLLHSAHEHLLMHFTRNGAFGPRRREPARARARRGRLRLRHRGQALLRRALEPVLLPSSATPTARRWRPRRGAAAAPRCRSTPTGEPRTRRRSSSPSALAQIAPGRPQPRVLHQRRLGVGRGGVEDRAPATTSAAGEPQRTKAIAREIAYHGVTLGALSFTACPAIKEPFGPPRDPGPPRLEHEPRSARRTTAPRRALLRARCSTRSSEAIVEEGPETVAMIIAEPVQNAGGCLTPPPGYWQGLRELCRPLRDPAGRRRGDHRLRPPRRVVRLARASAPRPT